MRLFLLCYTHRLLSLIFLRTNIIQHEQYGKSISVHNIISIFIYTFFLTTISLKKYRYILMYFRLKTELILIFRHLFFFLTYNDV